MEEIGPVEKVIESKMREFSRVSDSSETFAHETMSLFCEVYASTHVTPKHHACGP